MKNRTSLTLVFSLLICTLSACSSSTEPPEFKPDESANSVSVTDVPSIPSTEGVGVPSADVTEGDSNVQPIPATEDSSAIQDNTCPYKVVTGDKVYLQISNVKLRSDNLPLNPYFKIFGKNGDKWENVSEIWSQNGNQIFENVEKPSNFQFYVDSTYQEYFINVYSKKNPGNQPVARGVKFNINSILQWAKNPQNNGKTYNLKISEGNTIELKFNNVKKERYFYFDIVSYKITALEKSFIKSIHDSYISYEPKLVLDNTEYSPESVKFDSNSAPILSFDKAKSEILLVCTNGRYIFSVKNNQGVIDTIELSTNEIVKQLNDCMQNFPDDYTQWSVKCVSKHNSEVELSFAGINRIYRITTVSIPIQHSKRLNSSYNEYGNAPWMRVYIQQNGEPCGINSNYATTGRRSWDCDVPNDKSNRFRIREGMKSRFSLQIKDADTWSYEVALVEISGITDLDFAQGVVYEKLDSRIDDDDKKTKIQFDEVKE